MYLAVSNQAASELHPAVNPSAKDLEKLWQKGFDDAKSKKEPWGFVNRLRKGIGSIRTGPLSSDVVSFLWMITPEVIAYTEGFKARKGYWSDQEVRASREMIAEIPNAKPVLTFFGQLSIQPSFGGLGARVDRVARPKDLEGVRIVVKVGDKIIQPRSQPGDLQPASGIGVNSYDRTKLETTTTESRGTISGAGDTYSVSGRSTSNNYYTVRESESYRYYVGHFLAEFDLVSDQGQPLVPTSEKELEVIVVYGANERKAKFRLSDLLEMRK